MWKGRNNEKKGEQVFDTMGISWRKKKVTSGDNHAEAGSGCERRRTK